MYAAALTLNTPTGPLPVQPGPIGWFTLDSDPPDAKVCYAIIMDPSFGPGRARVNFPACVPLDQGASSGNILLTPAGYTVVSAPSRAWVGQQPPEWGTAELEPLTRPFPRPDSQRDPLLPVEPGDEYGNVSDTFPPEFLALPGAEPQHADLDLIRGDAFTYLTPFAPADINPACDTAWLESIGQNTNFGNRMWYTPLLPLYPPDVQDAFLADYSRYNTHLLLQGSLDPAAVRLTCQKARAAGLYACVFDWDAATFAALADCIDLAVIGLEVDKIGPAAIAAGVLDATIAATCATCVPKGIRVWLHFTSSGGPAHEQHWAFPVPGTSYTDWWAQNDRLGVTGLMYESWMTYSGDMDSAGKMGAMMFYARQGLHYSSNCLVCACEIMSAPPFMGLVDGPFAYRRATEMVCCPNGGVPGMVGVAGSFNGARRWDGSVF